VFNEEKKAYVAKAPKTKRCKKCDGGKKGNKVGIYIVAKTYAEKRE